MLLPDGLRYQQYSTVIPEISRNQAVFPHLFASQEDCDVFVPQDALRTAERRAAKAEADLQAEKAWVSNALRNYSHPAAPEVFGVPTQRAAIAHMNHHESTWRCSGQVKKLHHIMRKR